MIEKCIENKVNRQLTKLDVYRFIVELMPIKTELITTHLIYVSINIYMEPHSQMIEH